MTPKPLLQRLKANSELSQKTKLTSSRNTPKAELLDIPSIGEFYKSSITIVPLLKAFKKVLPDNAGEFVHWGATSQDIVDTGIVLLEKDAYEIILRDMKLLPRILFRPCQKHRNTVMSGRTHVVHALPITFGYKAAIWVDELGRDIERLEQIQDRVFLLVKWLGPLGL